MSTDNSQLKIRSARENNLKEVSLDLPHDTFTVLTGLSGSGKSSLAFDTVYAEGQRRYIETFSPYTRQFFDKVKKPDVDLLENVRPAIAIQQRTRILSSRSTVGSLTNINDYLKILWANVATPHCPECAQPLAAWDSDSLTDELLARLGKRSGHTILIAAAVPVARKSDLAPQVERLTAQGFSRSFNPTSGATERWEESPSLALHQKSLLVVIDRVRAENTPKKRIKDSLEQAFSLGSLGEGRSGVALLIDLDDSNNTHEILRYPNFFACPTHQIKVERPTPAIFSYNHPLGACPACKGFGRILRVDPALCVPNPGLSIAERALQCWGSEGTRAEFRRLIAFCQNEGIPTTIPWHALSDQQRELIFSTKTREYRGVLSWFKMLERKAYKMHVRVFLAKYRNQFECPECAGSRLRPGARAYRVRDLQLHQLWQMPVEQLQVWLETLRGELAARRALPRELAELFKSLQGRVRYLVDLGLPYLTLERQARTLSGGETQRVNLAAALGSELISTHFVLDEPSVGLHARDTDRLISSMRALQTRGNSLLVVEHDLDCIAEADHVVELGPEAGERGGEVVFSGPQRAWPGIKVDPQLNARVRPRKGLLTVRNATARNLKNLSLELPLGLFISLTGVSGSGKSTLVNEVLCRAWDQHTMKLPIERSENLVEGFEQIDQLLMVDQSPLAKSPRGNIGTYVGIWDTLRTLLAESDDAIARALPKSAFSFNVDGGRCPACKGAGFVREDMQFLSDIYIPCEVCLGRRFQEAVLEVSYKGHNAHEFLQMSVSACAELLHSIPQIRGPAETLCALGLGHLTLGHPLSELSGGEAQRLKLVPFISGVAKGNSLLIFDEPTTGLHYHDVQRLIELFVSLRERGHTVLCVEHNLSLIAASDWVIDLGPEGGERGGALLRCGTPAALVAGVSQLPSSHTAHYLAQYVEGSSSARRRKKTAALSRPAEQQLVICGAREHNLKNIDIAIPLGRYVALTGVSGSGKSTIAKDIIYAEGQRRYLDCLSPYARQYIKELRKPEIDEIRNVKPTICVYQHTFQPSRLSTIGTMSEIYNFLRLLYAKTAVQHCPQHPEEQISPLSSQQIAQEIKAIPSKSLRILAPVIKNKKGNHRAVLERAVSSDISQVRIDGIFLSPGSISMGGGLEKSKAHTIEFVVAKFNPANLSEELIQEAVTQALSLGSGTLIAIAEKTETVFSTERTCPICKRGFFKPDPEDLSFNSKRGACESCGGSGISPAGKECRSCHGTRINEIGRNLRIGGRNIHEVSQLTPLRLVDYLKQVPLDARRSSLAAPILTELYGRASALAALGLDYLPLARDCATLSGGELQRLRLAAAMGSPLTGVMYIFDEPSAGLHPLDNLKVLAQIRDLQRRGNSVIMIEHDQQSILSADYVIDVGPGGGKHGGEVVFAGEKAEFERSDSPTAVAIREHATASDAPFSGSGSISIMHGSRNNIRDLTLSIPTGGIITVAGVSGAGKSSLVHGVLFETLREGDANTDNTAWTHGGCEISATHPLTRVLEVDQKPIGANARSTPASYLGVWDEIRKLFAQSLEAKTRGWKESFFSYNTGKGRCPECKGQGQIKLEMSFLPDAFVGCESCNGRRYREEADVVRYLGYSISEALNLTFEEAARVFVNHRRIHQPLKQACELGLGYLTLGQGSTTLSGGESQRIKLVAELSGSQRGHTLYLLDEPTTGLHKADVARLMRTLRNLVALSNTVVLIEHDHDVVRSSDHVIELGPGPGEQGGKVLFSGSPSALARADTPWGALLAGSSDRPVRQRQQKRGGGDRDMTAATAPE